MNKLGKNALWDLSDSVGGAICEIDSDYIPMSHSMEDTKLALDYLIELLEEEE